MENDKSVITGWAIEVNGEPMLVNGRMPDVAEPRPVRCAVCDSRELSSVVAMVVEVEPDIAAQVGGSPVVFVRTRHQQRLAEASRAGQLPAMALVRAQAFQQARDVQQRHGDAVVAGRGFRFTPLLDGRQLVIECPGCHMKRPQTSRGNLIRRAALPRPAL